MNIDEYAFEFDALTPTELKILAKLHLPNKEIAALYGLTVGTTDKYVQNVFDKVGGTTRNRTAIMLKAVADGIVENPFTAKTHR